MLSCHGQFTQLQTPIQSQMQSQLHAVSSTHGFQREAAKISTKQDVLESQLFINAAIHANSYT